MTKLNWERVNMENRERRQGSEIYKDESGIYVTKKKKSVVSRRKVVYLIDCSKCPAQLNPKNETRHMLRVHGIRTSTDVIRIVSLAKEMEKYLPSIILGMAKQMGANINSTNESISLDLAEKIRDFIKGRA